MAHNHLALQLLAGERGLHITADVGVEQHGVADAEAVFAEAADADGQGAGNGTVHQSGDGDRGGGSVLVAVDLLGVKEVDTLVTANLTAATTTPDKVFGVLDGVDVKDRPVDVILPGCSGIVGVKLHSGSAAVVPGDRLVLGANGTVTKGSSGTFVAVAVGSGTAGNLTPVRLVQPTTLG